MNFNSFAQSTDVSVSLISELEALEGKFEVTFSYLDENVKDVLVAPMPESLTLSEGLIFITSQTNLIFHQIDQRFYSISKGPESQHFICAYLKDQETNEPISGAVVIYDTLRIVSNEAGYFQFNVGDRKSSANLKISHLSYTDEVRSLISSSQNECDAILLAPSISTLDEVTVFNYIARGIDKKVSGEYMIHSPQMQVLPGLIDADAFQGLQFLPGVFSAAESVSDINIRGGTNDQNLILWDGVRMYQTGHFFGLISIFNPYFTDNVTLTKNGTTAKQGDAVSGTIAVETDSQISLKPTISGGFNMLNVDVVGSVPIADHTSISMSIRRSMANLLQTPTYSQYYDRAFGDIESLNYSPTDTLSGEVESFEYYDLGLKVQSTVGTKDQLSLSFLNTSDELVYQEGDLLGNISSKSSTASQQSTLLGLRHLRHWTNTLSSQLSGYLSHYELSAENVDILNAQQLDQENTVLDWGLKFDVNTILSQNIDLSMGYHFDELGATNQEQLNSPIFSRKIKEVLRSHALYAEGNFLSDSKKMNLRVGLRANYYQALDRFYLEPRVTWNYMLTDKWSVEAAGELRSQTVTQIIDLQNDFLGVEKRRWVVANEEDLPVLRSKQASLGLQYTNKSFLFSIEGYRKYVDGIITSSQSFQNQFELVRSSGQYDVTGMDALVNFNYQKFSSWLSYTLSRNFNEFQELLNEKFPSNIDIRQFITNGVSYSSKKFECSLGFNWHTGAPFTAPDPSTPVINGIINYQFPNSSNLNAYFRADLSAKYKFLIGKKMRAQFGLSIWNFTNHKNEVNAYYLLDENDNPVKIIQNGLGLTPNVSARLSF